MAPLRQRQIKSSSTWVRLALLFVGLCVAQTGTAGVDTFSLSGKVTGGSGKHVMHVALWDAAGFLKHPVREIRIEPGDPTDFHFDVPPGRWALTAFEDLNDNGKLDMGMFGPKEPNGFWRPFHAWRKPRFDDVASVIDREAVGIELRLSKP